MDSKFNTSEYVYRVHQYLDSNLNETESTNFIKDVQNNPTLGKILNQERNLRTRIKNQLQRPTVGEDLINSIKRKLYYTHKLKPLNNKH